MKKLTLFLAVIAVFTTFAIADYGKDHMKQDQQTVSQLNQLQEGEKVELTGQLQQQPGEENIYLYQDDTGQIKVEISQDAWGDQQFQPDQKYKIEGEIVKEQDKVHIKADEVKAEDGKKDEKKGWF